MSSFPPRPTASDTRRRRLTRPAFAILLAGTMLTGVAAGSFEAGGTAYAQSAVAAHPGAIQPQALSQRLPDFTGLVKEVKPAVVSITSQLKADAVDDEGGDQGGQDQGGGGQQMPFPFPFPFQMQHPNVHRTVEARGSGFIISPDGFVVTNNHVVKGATSVSVTLDDGTVLPAKVVGRDARTDLALLRVKASGKLPFIQLGNSDDVEPGQWVIAVGNPYGLGGSVTAGIVSARGRDIGDGPYDSFLQIDAPINRGNSGGPLFTQDGKVVGVNTAILSPSGGSIGIGFAIPSDVVRNVIAQLQKNGRVTRGYLGVQAQAVTPQIAKGLNLPASLGTPPTGALVANVTSNSPAEKSGIKPGDVITQINGEKVGTPRDLAIKVASVAPDSEAKLTYLRDGSSQTVDVHVGNLGKDGAGPAGNDNGQQGGQASIGVGLAALTPDVRQQLGIDDSVHGAVVHDVQPNSAADQAGIKPGDIILGVGSHLVSNPAEAARAVHSALKQDQTVALRILRDGQNAFVAISPTAGGSQAPGGDDDDNGGGNQDNSQSG